MENKHKVNPWVVRLHRLYAVPFNVAIRGKKMLGLDAFFWNRLDQKFRAVLLVQPIEYLDPHPPLEACRLTRDVHIEEQIQDIIDIATLEPELPRIKERPSLGKRLLEMIFPGAAMARLKQASIIISEQEQARLLAKELVNLVSSTETFWGLFEYDEERQILLPLNQKMRRIYNALAERDNGYILASKKAYSICSEVF